MTWPSSQGGTHSQAICDRKREEEVYYHAAFVDWWQAAAGVRTNPQGPDASALPATPSPCWWLKQRERGRKIVGDGAYHAPKPHRYFKGQDLTVPCFILRSGRTSIVCMNVCVSEKERGHNKGFLLPMLLTRKIVRWGFFCLIHFCVYKVTVTN